MKKLRMRCFATGMLLLILLSGTAFSGCATTDLSKTGEDYSPSFGLLYFKKHKSFTMYLKFFEDGRVIAANVSGKYDSTVKEWFDSTFTDNQGTYSVTGNKITFFVEAAEGRVEYQGYITKVDSRGKADVMELEMHSLINGKKQKFKFKW